MGKPLPPTASPPVPKGAECCPKDYDLEFQSVAFGKANWSCSRARRGDRSHEEQLWGDNLGGYEAKCLRLL